MADRRAHVSGCLGCSLTDEELTTLGFSGDAGREVHGSAVVVAVDDHRAAMVGTGSGNERCVARRQFAFDQITKGDDGAVGVVELEHHGVADGLDEFVAGLERTTNAVLKSSHDGDSFSIAVRVGERGEPGEIDEGECGFDGRLADGCTVRRSVEASGHDAWDTGEVMQRDTEGRVVGRETELARFDRALGAAAKGSPSALLVSGDAGIGKSTLVAAAARRAGVRSFTGRCVHVGGDAIQLAPLIDLVRQVQRQLTDDAPEAAPVEAMAAALQPTRGERLSTGMFTLALDLVGALGAIGPVVVAIEDLHWGDGATWDVFEYVVRNLVDEHVVLVGTYRPDEVARDPVLRRRVAELARVPSVERMTLAGLDRSAVAAHAAAVLGIPAPPSLIDELVRRGAGNPFFTEELVAAHLAGEAVPALLSDLLEADISALGAKARQVVGAVAAVGRDTKPELLAAVVDMSEADLEMAAREVLDLRLLVVDPSTDSFRFRHPLIGEVTYAALLPSERRRIHRAVADALQSGARFALTIGDLAGELAFHLDRAGDEAAAFDAFLVAADAAAMVAPAACLAHLERALSLWDAHGNGHDEAERIQRLWQAADLASAIGDNARAVQLGRDAVSRGAPSLGLAWAHERLARFMWSEGRMTESESEYRTAAALVDDSSDSPALAAAFAGLGQGALMFGQFDSAERWSRRALEANGHHDPDTDSMADRVLGVLAVQRGHLDDGLVQCRQSVSEADAPHRRALSTVYLAIALLDAGRTEESIDVSLDGAADAQRAGFEASFGAYLTAAATHGLIRLGRWAEADVLLASVAGLEPFPMGGVQLEAAAIILAARRGDVTNARARLTRLQGRPSDVWHAAAVAAATIEVHLAAREWSNAVAVAQRALTPSPGGEVCRPLLFTWFLTVAAVERTLDAIARHDEIDAGSVQRDLEAHIETASLLLAAQGPVGASYLEAARATLSRLSKPDPDAFARAATAADDVGDPWMAAQLRAHEADGAAASGAAARAVDALRAAHEAASQLGAQPLLTDIDALAKRTRISVETAVVPSLTDQDINRLGLTPREVEVLGLVAAGHTNREIGTQLYVSEKTASVHVSNILRKLGVTTRVEAAAVAQRLGVA